jgi:hypothetical protein
MLAAPKLAALKGGHRPAPDPFATIGARRASVHLGDERAGSWYPTLAAMIAATIAFVGWSAGWRGSDLSAQLFRIELFRRDGMTLWNPQWYGGHFTISYSALYPPIAATLGLVSTTVLSAAGAAWCFARLVLRSFGVSARAGLVLFAMGTGSQVAIGQLPFLMGEALALAACLAVSRRRWVMAGLFALSASLASPLAGAFLLLVLVAWIVSSPPDRAGLVVVWLMTVAPIVATTALFPGTGRFPFPSRDAVLESAMVGVLVVAVGREHRSLRIGGWLYLAAIALSYAVTSPMGGNVSRLAESVAVPVAACVLWPVHRRRLVLVAIPMLLWQWVPALPAIVSQPEEPSTAAPYYAPLLGYFAELPTPPSRIEVVPTKAHYEVAYVAPVLPLARGWERQVDTVENPIFYEPGPLDAAVFRAWLLDTGVQYVALADAPLDYAAQAEGLLLRQGVDGVHVVWTDQHWTVFAVDGATGIVDGPATLVASTGDRITLRVDAPGTVRVRVRYNRNWQITPDPPCFGSDANGWITFATTETGTYELKVGLTPQPSAPACAT